MQRRGRVWRSIGLASSLLALGIPATLAQQGGQETDSGQEEQHVRVERPDATVVIREHPTGADMVEVTMAESDYPLELLTEQMNNLGVELNSMPRGLEVARHVLSPDNKELQFVKAKFAVDGLIDREGQRLNLQPLLRALAGAPEPHTVNSLLVILDGEKPTSRTVKRHISKAVEAEATFVPAPAQIEYQIRLKTQDPSQITFPDFAPEQKAGEKTSAQQSGTPVLFYAAIVAAALAVGALVYLALLRSGGAKSRQGPD
jgi:hypothetical protein